mgnify:CR=1 FL=1
MQIADKFVIRLPEGMRDQIRRNANASRRTMNAEIVHYIDKALADEKMATTGVEFGDQSPVEAGDHNTHKERCNAAGT